MVESSVKDLQSKEVASRKPPCFGDYDPDHPKCKACESDYEDDIAEDCRCESGTECWICDNKDECGKDED